MLAERGWNLAQAIRADYRLGLNHRTHLSCWKIEQAVQLFLYLFLAIWAGMSKG